MKLEDEVQRQLKILSSDVAELFPINELEEKLRYSLTNGQPLRVKMGIDPTSPDVHIGHMVVYKKMRQFQDLGHQALLIIGDYTARIGDPTGRNVERKPLTESEVKKNSETYKQQIFKIVDPNRTEIFYQSSWFDSLSLQGLLDATSCFSVAQMLSHETFRNRLDQGNRLSLHELIYPVLQAWDSVHIRSDVELGGTDQKFNILCGRDMQKEKGMKQQVVLLMPLLSGSDGRKMSKSFNNHIPVLSTPSDKFGRVMSIKDDLILTFFRYTTRFTADEVKTIEERLKNENPRDIKLELALEIVTIYHSEQEAFTAKKNFINQFSKKEIPEDIPIYNLLENEKLLSVLKKEKIIESQNDGRRLIKQGGISISGNKINDYDYELSLETSLDYIIKIGKRRFLRVVSS